MADISKIKTPDGTEYNVKDTTARSGISGKQATITASGVLIGDGAGGVTAKTLDTSSLTNDNNHVPTSGVVKSAISKVAVRPNLLRNWYFVGGGSQQGGEKFPINQRGQTVYNTAGNYEIDGWKVPQTHTTTLNANGVTVQAQSQTSRTAFQQFLDGEQNLYGKTVTGTILLTDGTMYSGSITLPNGKPSTTQYISFANFNGHILRIAASATAVWTYELMIGIGASVSIAAVKLELGDTQTLCHNEGTDASPVWVLNEIPDYATELAKCQQYLYVINFPAYIVVGFGSGASESFFRGVIPTPVTMRTHPTITYTTSNIRLVGNGQQISLVRKTLSTDQIIPNGAPFYCNGLTGLTTSALYVLEAYNGSIILSAET